MSEGINLWTIFIEALPYLLISLVFTSVIIALIETAIEQRNYNRLRTGKQRKENGK